MTVSSSSTYSPDIGTLILAAHELCGVLHESQGLSQAQIGRGRRQLDLLVDYLQAQGVAARTRSFVYVTLVSGTRDYTLAGTVLDVDGKGALIPAGQPLQSAAGETTVQQMALPEWHETSSKNTTGPPTRFYLDRNADTLVVSFWPTPAAAQAGASVRLVAHRLRADNLDAAATPDFERYWNLYLTHMLASKLARSYSLLQEAASLAAEAAPMLDVCRAAAAPQVTTDFVLGHSGGYR